MGTETYCFASAIMADDKRQGLVEFYDDLVVGTKGPNALDEHLRRRAKEEGEIEVSIESCRKSDQLLELVMVKGCNAYLINTTHPGQFYVEKSFRKFCLFKLALIEIVLDCLWCDYSPILGRWLRLRGRSRPILFKNKNKRLGW